MRGLLPPLGVVTSGREEGGWVRESAPVAQAPRQDKARPPRDDRVFPIPCRTIPLRHPGETQRRGLRTPDPQGTSLSGRGHPRHLCDFRPGVGQRVTRENPTVLDARGCGHSWYPMIHVNQ